jgi:hypothetical protein
MKFMTHTLKLTILRHLKNLPAALILLNFERRLRKK